eukprot:325913_1
MHQSQPEKTFENMATEAHGMKTNQAGGNRPAYGQTTDTPSQAASQNDGDLAQQESVVNINNRNVRLTLWCMVIFILATEGWRSAVQSLTYHKEDSLANVATPTYEQLEVQEDNETRSGLSIAAYSILWIASTVFLSGLYVPACNHGDTMDKISAVLLVIGGGLLFAVLATGIDLNCDAFVDDDAESNCQSKYVAWWIPDITVVLFTAIDMIKEVGKDAKIRLIVFCVMMAVRALLLFLDALYVLDTYNDAEEAALEASLAAEEAGYDTYTYVYANDAGYFEYRWNAAWHCIMMIFCVAVVVLILIKSALGNTLFPKLIGFVILFAHGAVSSGLWVTAVVLLIVYDIQYFW